MAKLGFADRKTAAPADMPGVVKLLAEIMSASLNNEVDLDNARVALTAATRIVEVVQADTRMKAVAMASQRQIAATGGWALIQMEKQVA